MITTKGKRVLQASGKILKNMGVVTVAAIATGMLTVKSKEAVREVGDGAKQLYNVIINTFQKE